VSFLIFHIFRVKGVVEFFKVLPKDKSEVLADV